MPQFDPTWFSSQFFWLAISFMVLYVAIRYWIVPRIGTVQSERAVAHQGNMRGAEAAKNEAVALQRAYESSLLQARSKAAEIMQKANAEMATQTQSRLAALDADLTARATHAEAALKIARDTALANIQQVAAEVASQAAARLSGMAVSNENALAAVQRAQNILRQN